MHIIVDGRQLSNMCLIKISSMYLLIEEGRVNLAPMISHKLPFAKVQEGFELATRSKGECIKIVVDFEEKGIKQ